MNNAIVVGWTDTDVGHAALDWSVHQALLTSRSLVLVHEACDPNYSSSAGGPSDRQPRSSPARKVDAIRRAVTGEFPDLEFEAKIEQDEPLAGLLRWSRSAEILAIGAPPNRSQRPDGGMTDRLVALSKAPVALVPRNWRSNLAGSRSVAVGVTPSEAGRAALRFAAREASLMTVRLVAVVGSDRNSREGRSILECVNDLKIEDQTLSIEVLWEEGSPAGALIDLSRRAQLVVLGCTHHSDLLAIRFGLATEAVLGRTSCPVVTVAPRHTGGHPADVGTTADRARPTKVE